MDTRFVRVCFSFVLFFLAAFNVHADLILTAPPRESAQEGQALYGPVAKLLELQLNETVVYEHPNDWMDYSIKMRQGHYDIVFDGPHFAAWRIKHLNHVAVAKLPGKLSFVVVEHASELNRRGLLDAVGGGLCALASPNLFTLMTMAQFNNPIIQPDIYEVRDAQSAYDAFQHGGYCRAVVLHENFFKKIPPKEREALRVVYASPGMPDQTVTVSSRVSAPSRDKITTLLTDPKRAEVQTVVSAYSKARFFERANQGDYTGLERMLEDELWGWSSKKE